MATEWLTCTAGRLGYGIVAAIFELLGVASQFCSGNRWTWGR
jgi:hypothetical protein